jgi:hypothetical protein
MHKLYSGKTQASPRIRIRLSKNLAKHYPNRRPRYGKLLPNAIADMQRALSILDQNNESDPAVRYSIEIVYSRILRDAGRKQGALRLESEATSSLSVLRRQQCSACTISAENFH